MLGTFEKGSGIGRVYVAHCGHFVLCAILSEEIWARAWDFGTYQTVKQRSTIAFASRTESMDGDEDRLKYLDLSPTEHVSIGL